MRISAILSLLAALLLYSASARAEDCKQLQAQSAQIACLQRELEALRSEVEQLRSKAFPSEVGTDGLAEHVVDEKIRQALADLERRLEEKAQPRVHLLDR
jgi:type II secretory pathway pseudopilin PulG